MSIEWAGGADALAGGDGDDMLKDGLGATTRSMAATGLTTSTVSRPKTSSRSPARPAASLGADDCRFLPVEAAPPEGGDEDAPAQGAPPDGNDDGDTPDDDGDDALSGGSAGVEGAAGWQGSGYAQQVVMATTPCVVAWGAGFDGAADLGGMGVQRLRVGVEHDEAGDLATVRADGAEDSGGACPPVLGG